MNAPADVDLGEELSSRMVRGAGAVQHRNVLIVDDEKSVATSVSFVVKHLGFGADAVEDAGAAIDRIRQAPGHYQLVITDHAMRGMDGLQLVKQLRAINFAGKILVLSGWLNTELEKAYRLLLVDAIIRKPLDLEVLRDAVRSLAEIRW